MQKFLFLILTLTMVVFSGCTRCVTCSGCPSGVQLESEEFCADEFPSEADFDQAIDVAEGFGCSCVEE